ncbi:MAG: glycine--tRNA ligase subunit beta [Sinobacteraceae bacterium]|nr:glycine--tRNA ligase subunit beta [Nevskiaceae bacterium]MCP5466727.1 glycine--tRNA ligase subunit beta [Nevskiaceae bacterium]
MSAAAPAKAQDFLVELGTEELPPLALPELERAFAAGIDKGLADAGLAHGGLKSFASPRRLAVLVRELSAQQPDQQIRRRGPPLNAAFDAAGQPTRAALAFAESVGVAVEALGRVREGKGEFLFHEGSRAGAPTPTLLPAIVQTSLEALPIPKRMRWGAGEAEFVRPVHWLVMLFGSAVVPARILDTEAGKTTRGHRFHAPAPLPLIAPADYAASLRERGRVLADFGERRERIRSQVLARAQTLGGRAVIDEALLDEVTALVEWPVAVEGRFEDRFLQLPREVLVSTLQEHQRYFAVEDANGALTPWFITVSNIESREPVRVREGNERVVRPRLSDAAFFYEQDRKRPLEGFAAGLDTVTFQTRLGSVGDKVRRTAQLAARLAGPVGADPVQVARAAQLAKCDLQSAMVGEFPELQGIMGAYYAAADGEPAEVASAVREHYQPRGAGDALPQTRCGIAVALADKLDTLAGIFAIGQKPTGTKDPFGLRRAAIGCLRIILEQRLDLDLRPYIVAALDAQPVENPAAAGELLGFMMERLRAWYLGEGQQRDDGTVSFTTEMFDAVLAAQPSAPFDFDARLRALAAFQQRPEAASLAAANKRIANILRKSTGDAPAVVEPAALVAPAEQALHAAVAALADEVASAVAARDYDGALARLASLRPPIDAFFEQVMVNDPDARLRTNRLALVAQIRKLFGGVADLSRLPG